MVVNVWFQGPAGRPAALSRLKKTHETFFHIFYFLSYSLGSIFYQYIIFMAVFLFNVVIYVFLLLCLFILIV
jgi:hypothetical protein